MTDEEIKLNTAIAEACEWWKSEIEQCVQAMPSITEIPDYCNDLNKMHEAEKYLMDESSVIYKEELEKVSCIWHSTAKQKAVAFLKAIGKWEE